ncbi:MAG: hypothetical protein J0M08_07275 [Bacteroidetes bacterium]|nr:hypothetical protein [Bacteroidota bacterium]
MKTTSRLLFALAILIISSCKNDSFLVRKYVPGTFKEKSTQVAINNSKKGDSKIEEIISKEFTTNTNIPTKTEPVKPYNTKPIFQKTANTNNIKTITASTSNKLKHSYTLSGTTEPQDKYYNPNYQNNYVSKQVSSAENMAIVAFVFIFFFSPLAIILGLIARKKIRMARAALMNHNGNENYGKENASLDTADLFAKIAIFVPLLTLLFVLLIAVFFLLLLI